VSNETALSIVHNLDTNSKFLIPVIANFCARDPPFIELLLGSNQQGIQAGETETASWDVATLVRQLYEQQSQGRYNLFLPILIHSSKTVLDVVGNALSSDNGRGNILLCLQRIVDELETSDLSSQQ